MRTWGRTYDEFGNPMWELIETDANGFNDYVWIQTLIDCLELTPNESPFWANYGIPAQDSVITQLFPDYYMWRTQQQFAQYFASLTISKLSSTTPSYKVNIMTNQGAIIPEFVVTYGMAQ